MSKRLPKLWQEVILVRHGIVMNKFNSNLVNFLDIFSISISGINGNANTIYDILNNTSILLNIDILQNPTQQ